MLYDMKLQIRHGFYYAYMLIAAAYIVLLRSLPLDIRETVGTVITFSDPSVLGFFFIGGLVLLEKGQNIYDNLFVTPYKPEEYILSKTLSLTLLSVVTSCIIHLSAFGLHPDLFLFLLGVTMTSVFFTLLGLGLAVRCQTLNGFFLMSTVYTFVFVIPLVEVVGVWTTPLFYFIPAKASLMMIQSPFNPLGTGQMIYAIGTLTAWIGIAWMWTRVSFRKFITLQMGGGDPQ
jgi:fluoroquinolone transport system permease protein